MQLPSGGQWLHEIKHDGFRIIARKSGGRVRLYSLTRASARLRVDGLVVHRRRYPQFRSAPVFLGLALPLTSECVPRRRWSSDMDTHEGRLSGLDSTLTPPRPRNRVRKHSAHFAVDI
jgi:hypothetical protein